MKRFIGKYLMLKETPSNYFGSNTTVGKHYHIVDTEGSNLWFIDNEGRKDSCFYGRFDLNNPLDNPLDKKQLRNALKETAKLLAECEKLQKQESKLDGSGDCGNQSWDIVAGIFKNKVQDIEKKYAVPCGTLIEVSHIWAQMALEKLPNKIWCRTGKKKGYYITRTISDTGWGCFAMLLNLYSQL